MLQRVIDVISSFDRAAIDWVYNHLFTPGNAHWVRLMGEVHSWVLAFFVIGVILIVQQRVRGAAIIIHLLLTVAVANFVTSELIKVTVVRSRPCLENTVEGFAIGCKTDAPSFPSAHATNTMALATATFSYSLLYGLLTLFFSIFIGLGRVYLGMHYPSDVVGGWLIGLLVALLVNRLARWLAVKLGFRWMVR